MPRPSIEWIEELAAHWEPIMRRAFLSSVRGIANRITLMRVSQALERGDIEAALRVVSLDPGDFSELALDQARVFHEGGQAAAETIPATKSSEGYRLKMQFNVRNRAAEEWVRDNSSRLIQGIIDDQRLAIRAALAAGLQRGQNPRQIALDLVGRVIRGAGGTLSRVGGIIGLHSVQEAWLRSYVEQLASTDPSTLRKLLERDLRDRRFDKSIRKAINEGTALPADIQERMRSSYAARALKWRADNIARTEVMRALGASQTQAWQQAIDKGQIDAREIRRYWVTAGDERVRNSHRRIPMMNKNGVEWNQPFATPTGPSMHAPHDTDLMCRCRERVDIDFLAKAVRRLRAA